MAERLNGAWRRKFASGKYVQIPKAAAAAEMVQAFELSTLEAELREARNCCVHLISSNSVHKVTACIHIDQYHAASRSEREQKDFLLLGWLY
eukprot:6212478-Pleurochrysis_carterae.AAC.2